MSLRIVAFEPNTRDFRAIQSALSAGSLETELEQARTREELFSKIKGSAPDVLLVDYARAEGGCMQAIMWSRNVSGGNGRVPVILVTDPVGDTAAVTALKAGASDYILKSELDRLPDAIRASLREHEESSKHIVGQQELRHATEQIRENQKLVTIGRLSGMIAHEINNPLAAIANLLYLLRHDGNLESKALGYLKLAENEMARVVQISRQTLSFYREANAPEQQKPQDLMEEVLMLYRRTLMEKKIQVRRRYDFQGSVLLYPGEMRQVFSNLVINAIESMHTSGTLTIHVYEAHKWDKSRKGGVRIVVADTGTGIPREKLLQIGEPFFTTKGQKGTGLGLWVSQGILRKYGGDLQVSSSTHPLHHGTVFSIFWPKDSEMQRRAEGGGSTQIHHFPRYKARNDGSKEAMKA